MRRRGAFVVAVVVTGLFVMGASWRPAALAFEAVQPTTLATVPGRVYAVAASAHYVAWRGCDNVGVTDRSGRRLAAIRVPKSPAFGCQLLGRANYGIIDHDILAIIGGTVSWSQWGYGNSTDYVGFGAAQIASGRSVRSGLPSNLWLGDQGGPAGSYIVGPAGDGIELLYGVTTVASDPSCTSAQVLDSTCPLQTSGTVWRLDSHLHRQRIAAAAATLIAFSGGRIALVPHTKGLRLDLGSGRLFRQPEPMVLLLRIANGTRIGTVDLGGEPYELALSPQLGAALVGDRARNSQGHITTHAQLQWFEPRINGSADSLTVTADAEALSVASKHIIFREGRRILSYVPGDLKPTLLAQAPPGSAVIGPILTGSRLVWGEYNNVRNVSHIRVLNVPWS